MLCMEHRSALSDARARVPRSLRDMQRAGALQRQEQHEERQCTDYQHRPIATKRAVRWKKVVVRTVHM